ncbi:MAG TPA: hypothetical protein VJ822_09000 [Dongiaceae bacterium]|nr:hypothetical protein [Dongiaceae bacterium]
MPAIRHAPPATLSQFPMPLFRRPAIAAGLPWTLARAASTPTLQHGPGDQYGHRESKPPHDVLSDGRLSDGPPESWPMPLALPSKQI